MGDKSDMVRKQITETADRLFYRKGYNQTSFSDIAEASQVPRGNFYYYFRTKDEILLAVIAKRMVDISAMLSRWNHESNEPLLRLGRFVQMLRNEKKDLARYGCPIGSLNIELGKSQPLLKARARAMFDLYRKWLKLQFEALGFAERARSLADDLLSRAQGIVVMTHVYADRSLLERQAEALEAWLGDLVQEKDRREQIS